MTYFRQAFAIGLSLVAGYFLVEMLLIQVRARAWLKGWLAIGLGLGLTSFTYFAWRLLSIDEIYLFLSELILSAGLGLAWFILKKRQRDVEELDIPQFQSRLPRGWYIFLNLALALAILASILTYIFGTLINPHGGWDAWAIWNLAARFLFSGAADWKNLFDPVLFHPDYPLLLGSSVARLWTYRSLVDIFSPAWIGFMFFVGALGLLMSLAQLTRGRVAAILAGLAFLSSSALLRIAPTQSADIPLAFYFLGALGCLSLYQKYPKPGFLTLTGILLGLGAWTKNEGWMLALSVLLAWGISMLFSNRGGSSIKGTSRQAGWIIIGFLPAIVLPLVQKLFLAPPTDLFARQDGATLARLADPARWALISGHFVSMLVSPASTVPYVLLILLALIFRIKKGAFSRPDVRTNLIAILLSILAFFLVYVITPLDLADHLRTSLDRVLGQLWPAAVFTLSLLVRLPDDLNGKNFNAKLLKPLRFI